MLRRSKQVIVGVAKDVMNNHIPSFAAALSYYFVLAFFPAVIAVAAFIAYLPLPNLLNTIIAAMAMIAPPESMALVVRVAGDVLSPSRGAFLSAGLLGALWTCSSGFSAVIEALNVAYNVPETRPVWKTRLLSLELTFLIGTLVTVAFAVMIVGPRFGEFLAAHLGLSRAFALVWPLLRYLCSVIFIVVAIEALYFRAPNLKQRFTATLPGAIMAVVGWILLSDGLSFYFRSFAHLNRTYGVLGGGIALLIWLYWCGLLILLGAELNAKIIQLRGDGTLEVKPPPPLTVKPIPATTADIVRPVDQRPPLQ